MELELVNLELINLMFLFDCEVSVYETGILLYSNLMTMQKIAH